MKLLNNMKVGAKIVLLVAVMLVCLALVAGMGVRSLSVMDEQAETMYSSNLLALSAAKEANIQLINLSRCVRNMALVTPDMRPRYAEAFRGFIASTRAELDKAGSLLVAPEAKEIHTRTVRAFEEMVPRLQSVVDNMGGMDSLQVMNALIDTRQYTDASDRFMTELGDFVTAAAAGRFQLITETAAQSFLLNIGIFAVALLLGGILGLMVKKAIANPLVSISQKASLVAEGDLEQDFNLVRRDELGSLAESLAQMVHNLRLRIGEAEQKSREAEEQSLKARQAMEEANLAKGKAEAGQAALLEAAEQVDQVVSRLSAATEELSAQVEQSSRGTEMQRDRVASSATAMEEMNSTVLEVARNAAIAAEGSDRARDKAKQGEGIVSQSVESIDVVQNDTAVLRQNMEELGRQAESIGAIMTVISDIADQTNLLALNAAIEAARAGEAGRGFAVVADEVRKLAEKTMTATKEVGDAISGIQSGAKQSISAVERTTGNLDSTTELVKRSGEALALIVQEVEATAGQVGGIAAAAEQQSAASEEITSSLDEINRMAEETSIAMQQSAQAVSDLAQQAQQLQTMVNELRSDRDLDAVNPSGAQADARGELK